MPLLNPGDIFARHQILGHIAAGRAADLYDAIAPDGARVTLKVHRDALPLSAKSQRRMGQESDAIATIEHVNCVGYRDTGIWEGRVWFSMERVDGPDLRRLMRDAGGRLPLERVVSILRQACEGVAAAHAVGVVHRDLRPENILVGPGDLAKVADFGSTKLPGWGLQTTTEPDLWEMLYAAPEYMKGRPADPASDVYGMGVLLYEVISGAHPFVSEKTSLGQAVLAHVGAEAAPLAEKVPGVPGELSELVRRAMAKDPAERPTMRELADGLGASLRRLHAQRRAAARSLPLPGHDPALAQTATAMPVFGPGGTITMPAVSGAQVVIHDPGAGAVLGVAGTVAPVLPPLRVTSPDGREAVVPPPPAYAAPVPAASLQPASVPPPPVSEVRVKKAGASPAGAVPPPPANPSPPAHPLPPAAPSPPTLASAPAPSPAAAPVPVPAAPPAPAPSSPGPPAPSPPAATTAMTEVPAERRSTGAPMVRTAPAPAAPPSVTRRALAVGGVVLVTGLAAATAWWVLVGRTDGGAASLPPAPAASVTAVPSGSGSSAAPAPSAKGSAALGRHRGAPSRPRAPAP